MVTVYRGHHRALFFLPGIISLFIRLLVGKCRWTRPGWGLNPGHWARHALLNMTPECFDHSTTWAGHEMTFYFDTISIQCKLAVFSCDRLEMWCDTYTVGDVSVTVGLTQQQLHQLHMTMFWRTHQRRRAVFILYVHVSTGRQQQLRKVQSTMTYR